MAVKIITCPWCGKEARITYEENRVYQMKCYECQNAMLHVDHSFDSAAKFFEHLANLLQAEKAGRLHVTPVSVWHKGDSGLHEVPYKPWMGKWIATGTKFWLTLRRRRRLWLGKAARADGKVEAHHHV